MKASISPFALLGAATLGLLLALPGHVRAAVLSYTNAGMYAAATTGNTTYAFPTPASGSYTVVSPSYADGPLTFNGQTLNLTNQGQYGSGVVFLIEANSAETIILSGATALSFTLGTAFGADTIAISVNGTPVTTVTEVGGYPNTKFIGFTDTVPITSLTFTNATQAGSEIDAVNFQVGTSVVPEPSTWALLGAGTIGLGLALRRRALQA